MDNIQSMLPLPMEIVITISNDVRAENGAAEKALAAKCNWERMSRTAVISEWGDPRLWATDR